MAAYIEWLSTNGHADQLATDGTLDYPRLDPQVFLAYLAVSRKKKDTGHNYSSSHLQKHKNAVFNAAAVSKATMPAGFDDQVKKWLSTHGKEVDDAKASGNVAGDDGTHHLALPPPCSTRTTASPTIQSLPRPRHKHNTCTRR